MNTTTKCFNCHQLGHFARNCSAVAVTNSRPQTTPHNQKSRAQKTNQTTLAQMVRINASLMDIGANLCNKDLISDLDHILDRSSKANVNDIILTGTSMKSNRQAIQLVAKYALDSPHAISGLKMYSTVGIHPHDASTFNDSVQEEMLQLCKKPGVVAIGECGLDYNRMFSPKQIQLDCFRKQIGMGIQEKLPLFCHEREAHEDFVRIVSEFDQSELPKIVVHCFTGEKKEVLRYIELGFYVGFTGTICMEQRGRQLREFLKEKIVPLDRLMIETDCPYMSPVRSMRRNEPYMLAYVCETLAECYQISNEEMATITTNNAKRFFNIAN